MIICVFYFDLCFIKYKYYQMFIILLILFKLVVLEEVSNDSSYYQYYFCCKKIIIFSVNYIMYGDNVYICMKIFFEYYLLIMIYVKRLVGSKMERELDLEL